MALNVNVLSIVVESPIVTPTQSLRVDLRIVINDGTYVLPVRERDQPSSALIHEYFEPGPSLCCWNVLWEKQAIEAREDNERHRSRRCHSSFVLESYVALSPRVRGLVHHMAMKPPLMTASTWAPNTTKGLILQALSVRLWTAYAAIINTAMKKNRPALVVSFRTY